ncbi:hypothetical protein [Actinoplanes sp. CA-252034]|uniref:hypothetical protein n=1 Tax=Actinoplanes sp. CA-252034 TaxID=3239906 RepID=UPI003D9526B8
MRPTVVTAALFLAAAALFTVGIDEATRADVPDAGSALILIIEPDSTSTTSTTDCPYEHAAVDEWAKLS